MPCTRRCGRGFNARLSNPRQIAHFSRAPSRDRGRRRVLVVDDSPIVRDLLSELLSSVGLEVRTAGATQHPGLHRDFPETIASVRGVVVLKQ